MYLRCVAGPRAGQACMRLQRSGWSGTTQSGPVLLLVHGDHGWGLQRTIEYGRQRYFLFLKKRLTFLSQRDFPDIGLGGGRWTLSKARCMQSAQEVLSVVRRGTRWSFRVTWSFSRWDVDAVARQHAIARAKDPCLSLLQWRDGRDGA